MKFLVSSISAAALLVTPALVAPAMAQSSTQSQVSAGQQVSDADLVDLADYADLVVRAKVAERFTFTKSAPCCHVPSTTAIDLVVACAVLL